MLVIWYDQLPTNVTGRRDLSLCNNDACELEVIKTHQLSITEGMAIGTLVADILDVLLIAQIVKR